MRYPFSILAILFIMCLPRYISGQGTIIPLLERSVTLHLNNVPLAEALDTISRQSGAVFSYNSAVVGTNTIISAYYNSKPLRMVLADVLGPDVIYKTKGRYIILKEKKSISGEGIKTIEGYIYDFRTGNRLAGASIYDKNLITSAVTNEFGYFSLTVPSGESANSIYVSKVGYNDTLLLPQYSDKRIQDVTIVSNEAWNVSMQGVTSHFRLPRHLPVWMLSKKTMTNSVNISLKAMKTVQLSLFPPISTNHFLSGNTVNKLSFNTTVGYVYGVDVAEIGGIMNIDLGNAKYFQGAGVGNIVGHNVTGFQAAGVFNNARNVKGVQAAGIFNISADSADVQLSGILNKTAINKVQISGIMNLAGSSAVQLSGILNLSEKSSVQVSGLVNCVRDADIQISGFFNYADTLKKLQLGVVNIAGTSKGVSVGIFSFIKNGYHKLDISSDENLSANLAFISGTRSFHTIVGAGYIFRQLNISNITYGFGTSFTGSGKNNFDAEIFSRSLLDLKRSSFFGNLYSLYTGIDHKMNKFFSLAAGLTFNLLYIDKNSFNSNPEYIRLAPYSITSGSRNNIRSWIGIKTSVRLF